MNDINYGDLSSDIQKTVQQMLKAEAEQSNRTWSFYEKMRREDPRKYREPRIQEQMVRDYKALGEKFEDGSFGKDWDQ
ncbi:hypothetical protein [Bradyrhizobium cenepequi]